ncbi:TraB/GumN family protein [Aureivirga sp. CE67]|uniref:TraB/GumN family protein n=1 Tax=Aureivirga sp. CE67 TaxID=1788983 RepID=UPI0018CB436C|nr:TraB/GumN family protein [Aureivirga sp. CE67]
MRKVLLLIVAVFIANLGFAQGKLENSTLWKITGNGLEKPSYLFGTIHIYCGEVPFDKEDLEAMKNTNQLALEIDMSNPAKIQQEVMQYSFLPAGKTVNDYLTPEQTTKIDSIFRAKVGMPFATFQTMKPLLVSTFITTQMLDCKSTEGYETAILKKFQGKQIFGLESVKDQMDAFDKMSIEDQAKSLVELADNPEQIKTYLEKMIEVYDSENIEELLKLMDEEESFNEEAAAALLDKRNQNWIPVMEKMMKENPTFFAVGAAHLAGDQGVVNLLRKAGYKVEAEN